MATFKQDFTREDPWRIFRIMSEFVDGFEALSDIENAVSIFGAARAKKGTKFYHLAEKTAYLFAKSGYAVITGSGPGIMEAANKGCFDAKGESIGLNILIPTKQKSNRYVTRQVEFRYFFCRKVMFAKYTKAFIVFPGGYGTFDELFEALALVQTQKMEPMPIILVGSSYWKGLLLWIKNTVLREGLIRKQDLNIFKVIDEPAEMVAHMRQFYSYVHPRQKIEMTER
ncbi:MAG: TIGR00730 family Rossman fold protein [Candidatus Omnitrophica bacterium]|nr:TIGR00730 family Rossman fold protein [Candidatus Omnitrophota bacterium]